MYVTFYLFILFYPMYCLQLFTAFVCIDLTNVMKFC